MKTEEPKISTTFRKEGVNVIKTTTLIEVLTPKEQLEMEERINQAKTQVRQQIVESMKQTGKLEEQERKIIEQSSKEMKNLYIKESKDIMLSKLKKIIKEKSAEWLKLSYEKTVYLTDYSSDDELYRKVLYRGFEKELSQDKDLLSEVSANIINQYVLARQQCSIIDMKDYDKELENYVKLAKKEKIA